jgi:hypothetical protein
MSEQSPSDKFTWLACQPPPYSEAEINAARAAILNPSEADRAELYQSWSRKAFWTPEEATALLLSVPPEIVEKQLYAILGPDFIKIARNLLDDIKRRFQNTVDPKELIAWANQQGIEVPLGLSSAFQIEQPKRRESDQTRVENNLLKALVAVAIDKCGYTNQPNSAAKLIEGAVNDIGLSLKDDAIRALLARATELPDFDWANVKPRAKKKL